MSKKFRAVFKSLLRKTDSGELEWRLADEEEKQLANERHTTTGPVYKTEYMGRELILASAESDTEGLGGQGKRAFVGGAIAGKRTGEMTAAQAVFGNPPISQSPQSNTLLIVKNPATGGLRRFDDYKILDDLLESVRKQNSNVDEWADDVLEED